MADKVCIPNDTSRRHKLIQEYHDDTNSFKDTQVHTEYLLLLLDEHSSGLIWLKPRRRMYVNACNNCARIKAKPTKPLGKLDPLPKATRPWDILSMDFIIGLALVEGYDAIATFVDTFTKHAHFIP